MKEEISYKHFTKEDVLLLENKKILSEIGNIFIENLNLKNRVKNPIKIAKSLFGSYLDAFHLFVMFDKGKVIGFESGVLDKKTFFIMQTQVLSSHQDKKIGTKLKMRSAAVLRAKYGVLTFDNFFVANDKIYSINEKIASRSQTTKKGKYVVEKDPHVKGFFTHDNKLKPRNILKFKKRGKR